MIKVNELRIGNILNYTTAENDIILTDLEWQDIQWISEDEEGFNLANKPIKLTEDWLLYFGFEKLESDLNIEYKIRLHEDFYFMINFDKNSQSYDAGYYEFDHEIGSMVFNNFTNGVHTVHQLQNLYFALRGQELKLK